MSKISCSQFIYGKFSTGEGGFKIVGHTQDLKNLSELQNILKKYKFWGPYPPQSEGRAVGFFPYKDKAVFVQVSPATGKNIVRRFDQYRYVFIPFSVLGKTGYRTFKLLRYFVKQSIPILEKFDSNLEGLEIPILEQEITEEERQQERSFVEKCLEERHREGNYYLLSSISAILSSISTGNGKQGLLINNISDSLPGEKFYLPSILLLLPAICRKEVSIAVGNLKESDFDWARLMIKTIDSQYIRRDRLPKNCVWLDRQRQELVGLSDSDRFQSKYVDKLRKFIEERQGDIGQLIEQLDRVNDPSVTLESLIADPDNVFRQVPLLYDHVLQIITILRSYPNTASWAELAGKECNLQWERTEDIDAKIKQLKDESGKCKLAKALLSNINLAGSILAEFAKLTQEEQGLTLTALIDYIDDCPDVLDDLKNLAYKLEPKKVQRVKFIDELLGSQDKFLTGVLRVWFDWIAEENNETTKGQLRENFLKPSFAWKSFQAQPKKYIRELLSENKLRDRNTIIAAFQCLVELDTEHFDLIRTDLLQYLQKCGESNRAGEQDRSSSYDNLIVQVASNGNAASLNNEDWDILAPILLHPNFSANIDPLVANFKVLPGEDRQIYCEYLVPSALKIVEKLNSFAETESLLNNCKSWEFSQNELTQVLDAVVTRAESVSDLDGKLDVEFMLDYIPSQSLKLHNIEEQRRIYSLLFRVRPSTGEQLESYEVFVKILRDIVLTYNYQTLKQWREEFYTQKHGRDFYSDFYSNDFRKAIDLLLETSPTKVENILKKFERDDMKNESGWLLDKYKSWLQERYNGINEKPIQQHIEDVKEELKVELSNQRQEFKEEFKAELSNQLQKLQEELKVELSNQRQEFKEELKADLGNQLQDVKEEFKADLGNQLQDVKEEFKADLSNQLQDFKGHLLEILNKIGNGNLDSGDQTEDSPSEQAGQSASTVSKDNDTSSTEQSEESSATASQDTDTDEKKKSQKLYELDPYT